MADAYVVGTADTKRSELAYVRDLLQRAGRTTVLVDVGLRSDGVGADVTPADVAAYHPDGPSIVMVDDRGKAVAAMSDALLRFVRDRCDRIGGVLGLGGSGGTAMIAPAMQALPVGVPKIMVSTVASGNVGPYVGPTDIAMVYSVTDVAGLNRISRRVLGNAAHALAGMMGNPVPEDRSDKPALGLTMFGVTTPCVQRVTESLRDRFDCLVFHATGTGGRSMEKLVDSGLLVAAVDLTTTEVCDMMMGGVFAADEDRLGAFIRAGIPYVGSVGALDMVNFGAPDSVPERYRGRVFVSHNPQVTLMRTTADENARMGEWIARRLNEMTGPVRFLIPEGGLSGLDLPGQPFHDPVADAALFDAIGRTVQETDSRRLIRVPYHINDPAFADAAVAALEEIAPEEGFAGHATT